MIGRITGPALSVPELDHPESGATGQGLVVGASGAARMERWQGLKMGPIVGSGGGLIARAGITLGKSRCAGSGRGACPAAHRL